MLFPTDPVKRPELWVKFTEKVASGLISSIVHEGQISPKSASELPVSNDKLVDSFQSANLVRFFSSRDQAIGPFVAFDVTDEAAQLVEYAIDTSIQTASNKDVQETFESISINFVFEEKYIKKILLPFSLQAWEISDWEATIQVGETLLKRTAS